MVEAVGLEPTTLGLKDRYSNQLSYASMYLNACILGVLRARF